MAKSSAPRKRPASIISIDSARVSPSDPDLDPDPVESKRNFHGNRHFRAIVRRLFNRWVISVGKFLRVPPICVKNHIQEILFEERIETAVEQEKRAA